MKFPYHYLQRLNSRLFTKYEQEVYMLWPASRSFLDSRLQTLFGVIVNSNQAYTTEVIVEDKTRKTLAKIAEEKGAYSTVIDPYYYPTYAYTVTEYRKTYAYPYTFNEFEDPNDHFDVDFFEHSKKVDVDGTEIYRFNPCFNSFMKIKKREITPEKETEYCYYLACMTDVVSLGRRTHSLNRYIQLGEPNELNVVAGKTE